MAIRKLGLSEVLAITLPSIAIVLPVTVRKKVELAEMSDGSLMAAFFKEHRAWEITFPPKLIKSELDDLITLRSHNQVLKWQNNDESALWYDVAITDFTYNTKDYRSPTVYYFASMSLEEIG
ncbi:hypothetical protein ES707_00323 [subsurface metagenome]